MIRIIVDRKQLEGTIDFVWGGWEEDIGVEGGELANSGGTDAAEGSGCESKSAGGHAAVGGTAIGERRDVGWVRL